MSYLTGLADDAFLERFWSKVDTAGDCWLWTASVGSTGYGQFRLRDRRIAKAHRLSYELAAGPIPVGMGVLHECDNPRCVRPEHLFLGTQVDNMADAARKGRTRNTPRRGEANNTAKLTNADVLAARAAWRTGASVRGLARQYSVHPKTMRNAVTGKGWAHV